MLPNYILRSAGAGDEPYRLNYVQNYIFFSRYSPSRRHFLSSAILFYFRDFTYSGIWRRVTD
jgi:hypothetical protein